MTDTDINDYVNHIPQSISCFRKRPVLNVLAAMMGSLVLDDDYEHFEPIPESLRRMLTEPKTITADMIEAYLRKHPAHVSKNEILLYDDYDVYRIDHLYPILYELIVGSNVFDPIREYRDRVSIGAQKSINRALYEYTRSYGSSNFMDCDVSALLANIVMWNRDSVGMYDDILIMRKGSQPPVFELGSRQVPAVFLRSYTKILVHIRGTYPDKTRGNIYQEWGTRTLVSDNGARQNFLYGFDINGKYAVSEFRRYIDPDNANASLKTHFIYAQLRVPKKTENFTSTMFDRYGSVSLQKFLGHIEKGLPLDDIVRIVKERMICTDCDCKHELNRFLAIMST